MIFANKVTHAWPLKVMLTDDSRWGLAIPGKPNVGLEGCTCESHAFSLTFIEGI